MPNSRRSPWKPTYGAIRSRTRRPTANIAARPFGLSRRHARRSSDARREGEISRGSIARIEVRHGAARGNPLLQFVGVRAAPFRGEPRRGGGGGGLRGGGGNRLRLHPPLDLPC